MCESQFCKNARKTCETASAFICYIFDDVNVIMIKWTHNYVNPFR